MQLDEVCTLRCDVDGQSIFLIFWSACTTAALENAEVLPQVCCHVSHTASHARLHV